MPRVKVNGKMVEVPSSATPEQIVQTASRGRVNASTRAVIVTSPSGNTRLKHGVNYAIKDGLDIKSVPDRVKADGMTYFGYKEPWQKQLIREQVNDVNGKFFKGAGYDMDGDCNWVVFHRFRLPPEWQRANRGVQNVRMMLIFPDQYPSLPTNGFYLPSSLSVPDNASHFYNRGFGGAFGQTEEEQNFMSQGGWKWYCTHIKPDAWQPARLHQISDWRKGDNLWDIVTLCIEVLTYPLED